MIRKIISGGQTGADQGGWEAAKRLGLETGGMMPRGFRTEDGFHPEFAELYNAEEDTVRNYAHRTEVNVQSADATVIFGDPTSSGSRQTALLCKQYSKGRLLIRFEGRTPVSPHPETVALFRKWITGYRIEILNVAGNRESKRPGIQELVARFLYNSLCDLLH